MKRIFIFTSNDLNTDQRMHRMAQSLHNHDWDITLIGREKRESNPLMIKKYKQVRIKTWAKKGIFFYLELNIKYFMVVLSQPSADWIPVDLDTLLGIYLGNIFRQKRIIWDCHEAFPEMPELYGHKVKKKIWLKLQDFLVPKLKSIIVVNTSIKNYFHSLYQNEENIQVINNYPIFSAGPMVPIQNQRKKILLFQGALNEGRCLDILISTMLLIKSDILLYIVGDGPLRSLLETLVLQKRLSQRVNFFGELDPLILKELTGTASIGISLLEKKHLNSYYSLANKNLDYIHAGLPCITMNFPEYASLNANFEVAVLMEEATETKLADAINNLLYDEDKYLEMTRACKEASKIYTWELESEKLINFLNKAESAD